MGLFRLGSWIRQNLPLAYNATTLLGAGLTTAAAVTLLWFWSLELMSPQPIHPYTGLLFVVVLPVLFLLGLAWMPLGLVRERRRRAVLGTPSEESSPLTLSSPVVRKALLVFGAVTVANVAILGTSTYKAKEYMDSDSFCGLACHAVMAPEHEAYQASVHARVGCVECHVGTGSSAFVRAKLNGLRQAYKYATGSYSRPVPSPVHDLVPASATCERCHTPDRTAERTLLVRRKHASDVANTPVSTVLVLKLGGPGGEGIHGRHVGRDIRYVPGDERRSVIGRVSVADASGGVTHYEPPVDKTEGSGSERKMDCTDCHNRIGHDFPLPERAVDEALSHGRLPRELPFLRKKAVELLRAEYQTAEAAQGAITRGLANYYATEHPDVHAGQRARVDAAGVELTRIYRANVYPELKLGWGTHPSQAGHDDAPGCFRCHDEEHKAKDGRTLGQDCEMCHAIVAQDENAAEILARLGWP